MASVIALVGRPNVGKSTLFNRLTRKRDALVGATPGVTRDRHYAIGVLGDVPPYLVIDTGGLDDAATLIEQTASQVWQAVQEADILFFIVDGRAGLNAYDHQIAKSLRALQKPVQVVVNKLEDFSEERRLAECAGFFSLGLGEPWPISAEHGQYVTGLIEHSFASITTADSQVAEYESTQTSICIVGRPNVGKSTLVNRLLGQDRMIVSDMLGTTVDSVQVPIQLYDNQYLLVDTAGLRKRPQTRSEIESLSFLKTIQTIQRSNIAVCVLDAQDGIVDQDLLVIHQVQKAGKALVLALNKWDTLSSHERADFFKKMNYKLERFSFVRLVPISAQKGTAIRALSRAIEEADQALHRRFKTSELTRILQKVTLKHSPPMVGGKPIKLRYIHQTDNLKFVIHGKRTEHLTPSYKRYLAKQFQQALKLFAVQVQFEFRSSKNPFDDSHHQS